MASRVELHRAIVTAAQRQANANPITRGIIAVNEALSAVIRKIVEVFKFIIFAIYNSIVWVINKSSSLCCRTACHLRSIDNPFPLFSSIRRTSGDEEPLVRTLSINQAKVRDVPNPIDFAQLQGIIDSANPEVTTRELLTLFDRLFAGVDSDAVIENDDGNEVHKAEGRRKLESGYIDFSAGNQSGEDYIANAANEIRVFLKMIALECRKDTIPDDLKRDALKVLIRSAHCPPRRHDASEAAYRLLTNQLETVNEILLTYLQESKGDLFLDYYSLSREPVMTKHYIAATVGTELGLDTRAIHLDDPHINLGASNALSPQNPHSSHSTAAQFREVFFNIYKPSTVIPILQERLNRRMKLNPEVANQIREFIAAAMREHKDAGRLTQADLDQLPEPYMYPPGHADQYLLTPVGVKFLLCHHGYFSDSTPNGHLVRHVAPPAPAAPVQPAAPQNRKLQRLLAPLLALDTHHPRQFLIGVEANIVRKQGARDPSNDRRIDQLSLQEKARLVSMHLCLAVVVRPAESQPPIPSMRQIWDPLASMRITFAALPEEEQIAILQAYDLVQFENIRIGDAPLSENARNMLTMMRALAKRNAAELVPHDQSQASA